MKINEFIEKAIEGGYRCCDRDIFPKGRTMAQHIESDLHRILLDPLAWQAVGKVEGWGDDHEYTFGETAIRERWKWEMHRMLDALAEGKTIEQYLETL